MAQSLGLLHHPTLPFFGLEDVPPAMRWRPRHECGHAGRRSIELQWVRRKPQALGRWGSGLSESSVANFRTPLFCLSNWGMRVSTFECLAQSSDRSPAAEAAANLQRHSVLAILPLRLLCQRLLACPLQQTSYLRFFIGNRIKKIQGSQCHTSEKTGRRLFLGGSGFPS